MPIPTFGDAYTEYSKIPLLRETLAACAEGRLDEAFELVSTVKSELTEQMTTMQDLYVLILASQGLLDNALANAIKFLQAFPRLAIGYNRLSELYMRVGQGLQATEAYEAGMKAIKKDNMKQRTILQTHRNELKSQYRDLIRLLPFEITDYIFQELDESFVLDSCAMVSKAWLQKVVHARDISTLTFDLYRSLKSVTAGRLQDYLTNREVYGTYMTWLESATPLETHSAWTSYRTHVLITEGVAYYLPKNLPSDDLQLNKPATLDARHPSIAYISSGRFRLLQQDWTKLRNFYLNIPQYEPNESDIIEGEEYMHLYIDVEDISELRQFIGEQRSRLRILAVTISAKIDNVNLENEFTSTKLDKLDYLYVGKIRNQAGLLDFVSELLVGAVKLKELTLFGITVHPETFEILKQMHQLEHLVLRLGDLPGVDTYLDHLAALGPDSPLKSITFYDKAFDKQTMLRIARVTTLMRINILHSVTMRDDQERDQDASWTLDFLRVLVKNKCMVERISIPDYATTAETTSLLAKLAALRDLEFTLFLRSYLDLRYDKGWENVEYLDIDTSCPDSKTIDDFYFIRKRNVRC